MPVMTRAELASALQFQAGDLIPIPIEEAVLDFAILDGTALLESVKDDLRVRIKRLAEKHVTPDSRPPGMVEAGGKRLTIPMDIRHQRDQHEHGPPAGRLRQTRLKVTGRRRTDSRRLEPRPAGLAAHSTL